MGIIPIEVWEISVYHGVMTAEGGCGTGVAADARVR